MKRTPDDASSAGPSEEDISAPTSEDEDTLALSGDKEADAPSNKIDVSAGSGEEDAAALPEEKEADAPSNKEDLAAVPGQENAAAVSDGEEANALFIEKHTAAVSSEEAADVPSSEKDSATPSGQEEADAPSNEKGTDTSSGEEAADASPNKKSKAATDLSIDYTFEGEDENDYTAGPSKMVFAKDGTKLCAAIAPSYDLSQRLQIVARDNRRLKRAEENLAKNHDYLNSRLVDTRQEREWLEKIATPKNDIAANEMRARINELRSAEDQILQELCDTRADVHELWTQMKQPIREILGMMDDTFVRCNLLPSPTADQQSETEITPIEDGAKSEDVEMEEAPSDEADVRSTDSPEDRGELERHHLDNYGAAKLKLVEVERQFDFRLHRHNQELQAFRAREAAGEDVGSRTDFCLNQHLDSRRLTRELIEAEEGFERVRAEVVEAGVDVYDIDQTSVFVDYGDNRYPVSLEHEMAQSAPRPRIEGWREAIPAGDTAFQNPPGHDEVQVDDWDARSVEVWDSLSAVAPGSDRRRIDRWRGMCVPTEADRVKSRVREILRGLGIYS